MYIVEHLDPELGPWSELEYIAIAEETQRAGNTFMLSSLPEGFKVPEKLAANPAFKAESRGVEEMYGGEMKDRVCLLDPQAEKDLNPDDKREFDVFLFGGILGEFWCCLVELWVSSSECEDGYWRREKGSQSRLLTDGL